MTEIMRDNVNRMLERGDHLDELQVAPHAYHDHKMLVKDEVLTGDHGSPRGQEEAGTYHYTTYKASFVIHLQVRSSHLDTASMQFRDQAVRAKRKFWWENTKAKGIAGLSAAVVVVIIIIIACW